MSRATGDDDAPLTQALDSFDQLSLRRDRERRRVTEEENAVRCLEELVAEKQREAQQLAREADSRAAELAALERRVPALEDTHRGARRSLQMLTEMRDLLRKQLAAEKRTTEEMLQKLDEQMQEAEARWTQYEFVYLTMPHYQRKLEVDALAGEERELTERRRQLEATLSARVSDRDFVVRLAECCWQARLLEGGRGGRGTGGGGGDVSPERENMSGACSQGFGTPRCSRTPSPVCDMEMGDEPDSGGSRTDSPAQDAREPKRPAYSPQPPPTPVTAGGDRAPYRAAGDSGERSSPSRGAEVKQGAPQRAQPPPLPFSRPQETPPRQSPTVSAKPGLYGQPPTNGDLRSQPAAQARPQCRVGLWPPQQAAASSQGPTPAAAQPAETATAPRSKPSPEKPQWDSEPAPSPRRQGSFMIQMPTLYRPSWPRAGATAEASSDRRPAVPASPARTVAGAPMAHRPPQAPLTPPSPKRQQMPSMPSPQRRQAPPTSSSMAQDVEMTDLQEVPPSPARARAETAGGGRRGSGEQAAPRDGSPNESPPVRRAATAAERQPRPPPVSAGQETAVSSPSAATAAGQSAPSGPSPPRALVTGRQYWLPLPPETPVAPPADERRSFVQQLRKSPELARRPPPPPPGRQTATPLEPGLEHRFLRPAVPSPHRATPAVSNAQSIFDTPRRPPVEPASPQRPVVSSPSSTPARLAPPSTPRAPPPPEAAPEPATPIRPPAAAGDAPRSAAAFFQSPEVDAGQLDASFSLFGGPPAKGASPQPPQPSSMSLFGAGDVGGDGDQGADDFSFSFFGGGARETEKEAASGGGGGSMFSFF